MEHAFEAATALARKSGDKLSKSTQLKLYTLFKQATEGDLPENKQRPSAFNVIERSKYDTWESLRGMTKPQAKSNYVQTVLDANIGFELPSNNTAEVEVEKQVEIPTEEEKINKEVEEKAQEIMEEPPKQDEPQPVVEQQQPQPVVEQQQPQPVNEKEQQPQPVVEKEQPQQTILQVQPQQPVVIQATKDEEEASSIFNTFSLATLLCMGMFAVGMGGFVLTILSWNALICLGMAMFGLGGMLGSLLLYIDTNGLIAVLPTFAKRILLESTLLEFLLNDSLSRLTQQMLPLFLLSPQDPRMREALNNLSPEVAQLLTQKGLIHSLPRVVQNAIVPHCARAVVLTSPPPTREMPQFPPVSIEDQQKLESAKKLTSRLVQEKVDFGLRSMFTPKTAKLLEMLSVCLASATLLQLLFSPANRAFLLGFVRALVLMVSMTGSGATAALGVLAAVISKRKV